MPIPDLTDCTTVSIFGPVSSGKTHLTKKFLDKMQRSITLDTTGEYFMPEAKHFYNIPAMIDCLLENQYYYRIIYHPGVDIKEPFHWCGEAIWQAENIPRWFIVEECHEVCGRSIEPTMHMLLRYSRKRQLGLICSSQRIADVSKALTDASRIVILFNTNEENNLSAIQDRWGLEVRQQVESLQPCIYDDSTKICQQVPECIIWERGKGYEKILLTEETQCRNDSVEIQEMPEELSSEPDSGNREPSSPESTPENS
jgi:hypothetical protein